MTTIHENQTPPASVALHTVTMLGMHRDRIACWLSSHGYHTGYIHYTEVGRVLSFREEDRF